MSEGGASSRRQLVARGIAWNTVYQIFEAGLAFAAMLVLVRIIPPAEYGRFGAVLGLLTLLNSLNFALFASQALQLPDGCEPDWSLHWCAGLYIQAALTLACHVLAGVCWFVPSYRPIAPLLHVAACGLILDWPAQLRMAMLRRELDFGRLKTLLAITTLAKLAVTLSLGLAGGGAYAIVVGSNVVTPVPLVVDLLLVCRWRPRAPWWGWPNWSAYRPALRFGVQQAGSALLRSARGAVEAAVLPAALGYVAIGLLNRANALFSMTVGRTSGIVVETAYPLLPRYAADRNGYPRQATLFAQIVLLIVVPGATYLGLEGTRLSRLAYGQKWIAADPLILPAALIGLGLAVSAVSGHILLAANRLRRSFALELLTAAVSAPIVLVAWHSGDVVAYTWALAGGQLMASVIALLTASSLLDSGWFSRIVLPPVVASLAGAAVVLVCATLTAGSPLVLEIAVSSTAYGTALGTILRSAFPGELHILLTRLPGGARLNVWLGLSERLVPQG